MEILYNDEYIVAAQKAPGILSQGDEKGSENMISLLSVQLQSTIYPIHRLDRNVGGVMVFAKTKDMAGKMSTLVSDKDSFEKEYLALVEGETDKEGTFRDLIYKSAKENKAFIVKKERKGVKEGILDYRRVSFTENNSKPLSLVKINLKTGRFHQIRVQFASRKMPLLGDGKYGSRDNKCDVALWSHRISFTHPKTGEKLSFTSLPDINEYPWNLFSKEIYFN